MTIRVLLADDHAILRDGLQALLEAQSDIAVVAACGEGLETVRECIRIKPEVVILDINMPYLDGIAATERITRLCPETRVLILSMHNSSEHVYRALRAGARAYVLKESAGRALIDAVRALVAGRHYFSESIGEHADAYFCGRALESPLERLSRREREILHLIVSGHSNVAAARLLSMSVKTVETYRSRMMSKLGLQDVPSLVKFAIQNGLTST